MSGAAGSGLRSNPDPTKTPAATETQHISLLLSYTGMSLQEETSNVISFFFFLTTLVITVAADLTMQLLAEKKRPGINFLQESTGQY